MPQSSPDLLVPTMPGHHPQTSKPPAVFGGEKTTRWALIPIGSMENGKPLAVINGVIVISYNPYKWP